MEDNANQVQNVSVEEDVISPVGWDGNTDFFEWAASEQTDAPAQTDTTGTTVDGAEALKEPLALGDSEKTEAEPQSSEETKPATPSESGETAKLKFSAKVNHKNVDVELDQSELPDLYETAQAAKRYKNRLNAKNAEMEQAEIVANLLGYDSIKEMLDSTAASYEEGEIQRLISEKVHPDIAKDNVQRKIQEIKDKVSKNRKPVEPEEGTNEGKANDGKRDFTPEVAELLATYPEYKGQTLPQEVVDDCLKTGKPLVQAVAMYRDRQKQAELNLLRKENKTLKQNAETAKRAPVRSVASGGATNTAAEDPFLAGFGKL